MKYFSFFLATCCFSFLIFAQDAAKNTPVESMPIASEECATYPGGYEALMKFLQQEISYPQECIETNISGKVMVRFSVDHSGKVNEAKVVNSIHPVMDAEALRVVNMLQWSWNPGCIEPKVFYSLPINFALGNEDEPMEEKADKPSPHFVGFDIGMGTFIMDNPSDYPYWNQTDFNLFQLGFNIFEYKVPIFKEYLGLTTGLGVNTTRIQLGQYDLVHTATIPGGNLDTLFAIQTLSNLTYRSNNLTFAFLTVPLLLEVCSKAASKNSFYLNVGAVGYWSFSGSWTTRGKYANGDRFNNNVNSRFQMAPFGAYATARTGFDRYGLFVNYNLTPLFKKSATATLYPLTFGITLNFDY
jgi:TonB family protein